MSTSRLELIERLQDAEDGQRYWQDRCREHIKARNELRADLGTTRAALRAVEKLADKWPDEPHSDSDECNACWVYDIRQALAGIDTGRQG